MGSSLNKLKVGSELTVCRFELSRFDKMGLCSVSVYQIEVIDSAWVYFAFHFFFFTYKWNQNGRIGIATILSYELFSSLFGLVWFGLVQFHFFFLSLIDSNFLVECVDKEFFCVFFFYNCNKPINYLLKT